MTDPPISQWLDNIREGLDPVAEQGIWEQYFRRLVGLARIRLHGLPTAAESAEDVAVSAMKSFFCRLRTGSFPELRDRTELWPLLVQTTIWKVNRHRRSEFAEKRDARRSVSIQLLQQHDPNAELADSVVESGNVLLESLADPKLREVAALKLEGYTNAEIAEQIGRTVSTVEWRLRQVRKQLQSEFDAKAGQ